MGKMTPSKVTIIPNLSANLCTVGQTTLLRANCECTWRTKQAQNVTGLVIFGKKSSAAAEMGDRATAKWAEKWWRGLLCPFRWGSWVPV